MRRNYPAFCDLCMLRTPDDAAADDPLRRPLEKRGPTRRRQLTAVSGVSHVIAFIERDLTSDARGAGHDLGRPGPGPGPG